MWRVGWSNPHDQLNAAFENALSPVEALERMAQLKRAHPEAHVWARGDSYDLAARTTKGGEVGFVLCPTAETDSDPPADCRPYDPAELLELIAAEAEISAAEEDCPTCARRRRGRYANRSQSSHPLFLCSTCEQWTETLPKTARPGLRSRRSALAE